MTPSKRTTAFILAPILESIGEVNILSSIHVLTILELPFAENKHSVHFPQKCILASIQISLEMTGIFFH